MTAAVESWPTRRLGTAVLAAVVVVAGCSGDDDEEPFPLDTMPARASPTAEDPSPTEAATSETVELPQECGAFISYSDVVQAVGVRLTGGARPTFVDGGFHPDSGRLQQLRCQYSWVNETVDDAGDAEDEAEPEIALTIYARSYIDAEHAQSRVNDAVDGTASEVEDFPVSGVPGFTLRDDETITYVVAQGQYTFTVQLQQGVVPDHAEPVVIVTLAEQLLGALEPEPEPTPTS